MRGVHDFDDLRGRSRIDEETDCWIVDAHRSNGSTILWVPAAQKPLTLTACIAWLKTGAPAKAGTMWVAMCGNTACGNPAHRKLGDRGLLMRVMRPKLDPLHRAKIQLAALNRSRFYSPKRRDEILASDESCQALARRIGLHPSVVSRVRRGETWATQAQASSVFSLGAAGAAS